VYTCVMDGKVWKTLPRKDGSLFFDPAKRDVLRVGIFVNVDWFKVPTSYFAASHSSGPFSFSIANLLGNQRYLDKYTATITMTPGPDEPSAEELQEFSRLLVDDLIKFEDHPIIVGKSPERPEGARVAGIPLELVLVGIIADHPCMCKLGGVADHAHKAAPCTNCKTTRAGMYTDEALKNGCPPRTGADHKRLSEEYRQLKTTAERAAFAKEHGVRWTEFVRLHYFDPIHMTIIDPMHCIILGLGKNQWFSHWIQTNALRSDTEAGTQRELHDFHAFLDTVEIPSWVGHLPRGVGNPAGGSLSADEYKVLMTCIAAMVV
ncbi:hypothetical protein K488DRAFT_34530, partial [Vararia minispora EC-137]